MELPPPIPRAGVIPGTSPGCGSLPGVVGSSYSGDMPVLTDDAYGCGEAGPILKVCCQGKSTKEPQGGASSAT